MATTTPPTTAPPPPLTLSSATSTVLHDGKAILGESPVHDVRTGAILFVDIEGRKVVVVPGGFGQGKNAKNGAEEDAPFSIPTPLPVGGVTPTTDPHTLLVSQPDAVHLLDLKTRTLGPPLATIPPDHALPGTRFNDGLASPQGVWVGGRLHKDWREGKRGRVYALVWEEEGGGGGGGAKTPVLKQVLKEEEVGMSNGMAWADGPAGPASRFYLADSAAKCVLCFDADPATGIPVSGTGRVAVSAAVLGGAVPDGLCLDGGGRVWVALAESGCVGVFAPDAATGGAQVGRVTALPFTRLTSCAWGRGEEGGGLLIVTSREEKGDGASPAAGAVAVVAGSGGRGDERSCGVVRLGGL